MSLQLPQYVLVLTVEALRSIIGELKSSALPRIGNSDGSPLVGDRVDCVLADHLLPALESLSECAGLNGEPSQTVQ